MKISKVRLKQIIKEELEACELEEGCDSDLKESEGSTQTEVFSTVQQMFQDDPANVFDYIIELRNTLGIPQEEWQPVYI